MPCWPISKAGREPPACCSRIRRSTTSSTATIAEIHTLVGNVNAGKGTLGKLLKDDQLEQQLDTLVPSLNTTIDKIDSGQGTLGQFIVNPQLYQSMNATVQELQSLTKDIRTNPKKFLSHQAGPVLSPWQGGTPPPADQPRSQEQGHGHHLLPPKRLVVNADDFGFTPGREPGNRGSPPPRHPHRHHPDGQWRGVRRRRANAARANPALDIGCHLVLIGGSSLVTGKPFPDTVPRLVAALALREVRPYDELEAQVRKILDAGIQADASRHPQAHASCPAGSGRGGAAGRGIRHPLGAPPVRFPHERAARRGSAR